MPTRTAFAAGPAGELELAIDEPAQVAVGVAVICHPHPLHGGTLDNKVVQTVARAALAAGWRAVRFNFRGVGASAGAWDDGRGECEDVGAVVRDCAVPGLPMVLAGFSFGAAMAARVAADWASMASGATASPAVVPGGPAVPLLQRLLLIAPAVSRFDVPPVRPDTLVIHGDADDVVPLPAVLDWARPQSLPVLVLPGVGHFFHGHLPQLKALVAPAFAGTAPPSFHPAGSSGPGAGTLQP